MTQMEIILVNVIPLMLNQSNVIKLPSLMELLELVLTIIALQMEHQIVLILTILVVQVNKDMFVLMIVQVMIDVSQLMSDVEMLKETKSLMSAHLNSDAYQCPLTQLKRLAHIANQQLMVINVINSPAMKIMIKCLHHF